MSLVDEISECENSEAKHKEDSMRFGLCPFSDKCELYYPHDYHCNQNRTIFLIPNRNYPSCYKREK